MVCHWGGLGEAEGRPIRIQAVEDKGTEVDYFYLWPRNVPELAVNGSLERDRLTAQLGEGAPESHNGRHDFTFRVAFSEDVVAGDGVAPAERTFRDHSLEVTNGSVTNARRVNGQRDLWEVTVKPDFDAFDLGFYDDVTVVLPADRRCDVPGAICTSDGERLSSRLELTVPMEGQQQSVADPLRASFNGLPNAHDGESNFSFRIEFSEDIAAQAADMRDHALTVTGGSVTSAARMNGRDDLWTFTVTPSGTDKVSIQLEGERACTEAGAVCTANGSPLSNSLAGLLVYVPPAEPLTASFSDMPVEHTGAEFTFELTFSEEPEKSFSYRTLRDAAFEVTGGAVRKAKRRQSGSNLEWTITVEPDGYGAVTIRLPETSGCNASGAICTGDGRPLSHSLSATVQGSPALNVADAEVHEGPEATLDFVVTLSRQASGTVMVDYATADGSATAGADYTATSGTLTFQSGQTVKTVKVPVLEDAHDDGGETLTLSLANASGARIEDGEATRTIENTAAIPKAWLARFGRVVTGQVLDAVEARLKALRTPGMQASLAGQALPSWNDEAAAGDDAASGGTLSGVDAGSRDAMVALGSWLAQAGEDGTGAPGTGTFGPDDETRLESRTLTGRDFVTGTSFALTGGSAEGGGFAALWGRGGIARFDGREGDLALDGEVATGLIGADWTSARWTAGLAVGHSRGTGGYRSPGDAGDIDATLTGVYPYAGLMLSDQLSVWTAADHGVGEVTVTPEGREALTAALTMTTGAAGMRSELLEPEDAGGTALAVKTDGRFTRTSSEAVRGPASAGGNLNAADADVWLLRTGVEGARRFALGEDGTTITPSFEIGLRLDGGDAETGFGADLGGGLAFADPKRGLSLELKARGLLAHEASGFREWGANAGLAWGTCGRGRTGVSRCRCARAGAPRPRAAWTRCSGARRWPGSPRTTTGSRRRAAWRRRSATASRCSAASSPARRTPASDSPTRAATTGSAGG